jgi:hypothetical protein
MFDIMHVPIMGFTQNAARRTGLEDLWYKMRRSVPLERHSVLPPLRWNSDFKGMAEFIRRNLSASGEVRVYAYSWGCGHGALKLARELHRRGITVTQMVLCDPVYHSWFRPWRGLFQASWNPPIVYPPNVRRVISFFQRQNRPQGVEVLLTHPEGIVEPPVQLHRDHAFMDDAAEFHDTALSVAALPAAVQRRKKPP